MSAPLADISCPDGWRREVPLFESQRVFVRGVRSIIVTEAAVEDVVWRHASIDITPKAGDVSVCFGCAKVGIFTGDGLNVRPPQTAEEFGRLTHPAVMELRLAILLNSRITGDGLPDVRGQW